ncbi:molybdopterin converting factor subunit 1 [Metabacillus fastidiosus]|uniref:molybdopterin converting factor subunit 1 n=1 Tax=Metabacillus fastidiosus TaxID=1458 RepID=UPI002E24ECAF
MMNKVLLFAHLQEAAGKDHLFIQAAGLSVKELRNSLENETRLSSLQNVMIAINENYATDEDIIEENDVIALIPPVSGG